jgi:hypothetical protein
LIEQTAFTPGICPAVSTPMLRIPVPNSVWSPQELNRFTGT